LGVLSEAEREAVVEAAASSPEDIWQRHARSLGTWAVDDLSATFNFDAYTGKYEARIAFSDMPPSMASVACTDLKWRALGRRLLAARFARATGTNAQTLTLAADALRDALGAVRRCWVVLGTARSYHGQHWPLIVGVHTVPEYEAEVDYRTL